jgi:pentatricopeptide repeat protein
VLADALSRLMRKKKETLLSHAKHGNWELAKKMIDEMEDVHNVALDMNIAEELKW